MHVLHTTLLQDPGRAGVRLSEPAQAAKAGYLLYPSCGFHPLTQLRLGPDPSESQLQGKARNWSTTAFPGSQQGEGGVGSADSPTQEPAGRRLWKRARVGRAAAHEVWLEVSGCHAFPADTFGCNFENEETVAFRFLCAAPSKSDEEAK